MSLPPNNWISDANYNKFKGSYVNGDLDASQNIVIRNGNLYMPADSNIYSPSNRIFFNETYLYTNFAQNVHIYGTLQLDRAGTTYDVAYEIVSNLPSQITTNTTNIATNTSGISTNTSNISSLQTAVTILNTKTTNITYASSSNTTTFSGVLSFPATSIDSASVINNSFLALTGAQSCSGNKTFAGNIIVSASGNGNFNGLLQALGTYLRVDGDLKLGTNTITISQATLQKLQFLSTLNSDVQNQLNNINTSALLSTANTWSQIQNFSSPPVMSGASISSGSIPNSALATTYIDNSTAQTIAGIKTFSSPPILSGASITAASIPDSALVSSGFVNLTTAQTIAGIKTFSSPPILSGASITASSIPNSALATAYMDLATNGQIITGNKVWQGNLSVNSQTVNPTQLGYLSGVSSAIQTQLNACAKAAGLNIFSLAQVFSNNLRLDGQLVLNAGALAINNSVLQSIQHLNGVSSNIATSFSGCAQIAIANTFTLAQSFSNNIRLDGSLLLNSGLTTISNSVLQSIQYLDGVSSSIQTQFNSVTGNISTLFSYQPVGVIITSLVYVPSPFFLCNGAALSRTTYSALFTAIGTTYGAGDGSTTFNIPNYAGMFLRGQGAQTLGGVAYSSAGTIATFQADSLQDHIHAGQSGSYLSSTNGTVSGYGWTPIATQRPNSNTFTNTGGVNAAYRSSTETRPCNYGVYYYIKCL